MIKNRFLERNYNEVLLDKALTEVTEGPLRRKCVKQKNDEISIPFISGYSKEALKIKKLIQKSWYILKVTPL